MKSPLIPPKGDNFDPKQFQLNLWDDPIEEVLSEIPTLSRTSSFQYLFREYDYNFEQKQNDNQQTKWSIFQLMKAELVQLEKRYFL